DLVVLSVLLDAGAGSKWKYRSSENEKTYDRSEGLAVASYDLFEAGAFSEDATKPFRATAKGLRTLSLDSLKKGFQVSATNPIEGLEGRLGLLNRLGDTMEAFPEYFKGSDGGFRP